MNILIFNMKKFICKIFGHKYSLIRRVSPQIREIFCERCLDEFAMHDGLRTILPMDDELRDLHKLLRK